MTKQHVYCLIVLLGLTGGLQPSNSKKVALRASRPCKAAGRQGIPKVMHHIFLDGEAAYWRNATLGDSFTPNFYPTTREKGDKNITFKHEWKTGCQRLMPDWRVQQTCLEMHAFCASLPPAT